MLPKKILRPIFVSDTWHNAFSLNIITLLENVGWNLVEGKYKIQWFESNVFVTSIDSACIHNDEEDKITSTEYELDSDIYSDSDEK